MNLFRTRYKDEEIVVRAEQAIAEDTVINAMSRADVSSGEGVVTIRGHAASKREKQHIEDVVRHALEGSSLVYARIDNQIDNQIDVN